MPIVPWLSADNVVLATHIASVIVHGGIMIGWAYVLTIFIPLAVGYTTVVAYPGNMLFNHLTNLENSSTEPSFVTTRSAFQL